MTGHKWPNAAKLAAALAFSLAAVACDAAEGPRAVPTFHCIGLYWSPQEGGDDIVCRVRYRLVNSDEWKEALPLWFDARGPEQHSQTLSNSSLGDGAPKPQHEFARQYRGSIVNLAPGTEYDIELSLEGTEVRRRIKAKTWGEHFPIGKAVVLPETSHETLVIEQSGSPESYILYAPAPGKTATIDARNRIDHCVEINASYVIVRGLALKDARSHAIRIIDGHDIVIEECDISGWGLPNAVQPEVWGKNMEAAVYAREADPQNPTIERVIVQRCRVHHPRHDTNSWDEYRKEKDPEKKDYRWHPGGPQFVTMYNTRGNHVFRYNEVWSDAEHYYNDILGGGSNYSAAGFPNRDSDIYGNRLANCWDDAIESEGANCNVRIWGNHIDQTMVAIATAAAHVGPLYMWRNVAARSRWAPMKTYDEDKRGPFLKAGSSEDFGGGRTYVFHNTLLQPAPERGMTLPRGWRGGLSSSGGPILNHVSRNNILQVHRAEGSSVAEREGASRDNDFDHDLYNGLIKAYGREHEKHGIVGEPIYDPKNGPEEFALAPNSPGYDAGVRIPNFNDGFTGKAPDMGAHEAGTPPMEFGVNAYRGTRR